MDIAKDLPNREDDADQLDVFRKAVKHADARQLCTFREKAVLSKKNDWKGEFMPIGSK